MKITNLQFINISQATEALAKVERYQIQTLVNSTSHHYLRCPDIYILQYLTSSLTHFDLWMFASRGWCLSHCAGEEKDDKSNLLFSLASLVLHVY